MNEHEPSLAWIDVEWDEQCPHCLQSHHRSEAFICVCCDRPVCPLCVKVHALGMSCPCCLQSVEEEA